MPRILNVFIPIIFFILTTGCREEDTQSEWERVVKPDKEWKFSIGDDTLWASPQFNDSEWDEIRVPAPWEDEGFHGYDGYAWYRQRFEIPGKLRNRSLYLFLGNIDDVDEVYFNGQMIGFTGSFPPKYATAYNSIRRYPIPPGLIKYEGQNTVAVRVYDSQLGGGIIAGEIGIYDMDIPSPDISLIGQWNFRTGDDPAWKETGYNDASWDKIIVPGFWESQGYYDYDGFAWYRKEFDVPAELSSKKLILLMGRIDDFDEVYLNGELIGSNGDMSSLPSANLGETYQVQRNYFLKQGIVRSGKNIISVRVYDGFIDGGIYKGPVGLIAQERYRKFWKEQD